MQTLVQRNSPDIKCRKAEIHPRVTVLVSTLRGLKMHGGLVDGASHEQERQALMDGFANLDRHKLRICNALDSQWLSH